MSSASVITQLSKGEKRELLARLLSQRLGRMRESPLSFGQRRLWFLEQLEPGTGAYIISIAIELEGVPDWRAFRRSFQEIVQRHDSLRTSFVLSGDEPVQRIAPRAELHLPRFDLSALQPGDRRAEARRGVAVLARQPFDLGREPLLRVHTFGLSGDRSVVLLMMHHIISDGWSLSVLIRELGTLYEAFRQGRPSPLSALPLQYADYVDWQHRTLTDEVLAGQLAFWRQQLADASPILQLPTDRPRPTTQTYRGAAEGFEFDPSLRSGLSALGRREGTTLFMSLLAAVQVLLYRHAGQTDISIGTPVANRNRKELEALIGFFVNTLVLRGDLRGRPSFRRLLGQARERVLGALAHQDTPFEKVVEELQPERDISFSPLFQVEFTLQNLPASGGELSSLRMQPFPSELEAAKFDLTIEVWDLPGHLAGAVEYSRDLFDRVTILRLLGHFERLLGGLVAAPDAPVDRLPLLAAAERAQVQIEWNDSQASYPSERCAHQLIEERADGSPDRIAVVWQRSQLTYAELAGRARGLARELCRNGVGAGDPVAVVMERSPHLLVAMLAIFKAAAVYLPLEPAFPAERFGYILNDGLGRLARPILLTTRDLLPRFRGGELPTPERGTVLAVDALELAADARSGECGCELDPGTEPGPSHLAYVIYTSGSTGRPKGAMVDQRGMLNHLFAKISALGIDDSDVIAQTASQCFDISVWQFLAALQVGGRVHIFDAETTHDPALFLALLERARVTIVETVPPFLHLLVDEAETGSHPPAVEALRWMVPTGEALAPELARRWLHGFPSIPLLNAYGPTECSDDVTHAVIAPRDVESSRMPIGRPVANLEIHIVDSGGFLAPLGVVGEILIGGEGVGQGYLGRTGLTAERFIPDGLGSVPGARLYRTGDLGRWGMGGSVECLGRVDDQIKVRGFRIELGEIEAALGEHARVRDAVVQVRQERGGEKWLVAFVAPRGEEPARQELRTFLLRTLPEYMVPARFQLLESLPLLPSGKVDRKALAAMEVRREIEEGGELALPRTAREARLAEIWGQVLRLEAVGVDQNFFGLGGDSILSLQVVSRARRLGLMLTPRQIFERPTIRDLAEVVEQVGGEAEDQGWVAGPVAMGPAQRWFFDLGAEHPEHFNLSLLLEVDGASAGGGRLAIGHLRRATVRLLEHHDALRMRYRRPVDGGGEWSQEMVPPGGPVPCHQVDVSSLDPDLRGGALERTAGGVEASLDLEAGPLLRVVLFRWGSGGGDRLLLIAHHSVVDGVSWRLLLEDLEETYQQLAAGEPVRLPAKTASYQRWAEELRAQAGDWDDELGYWEERLARAPSALPIDRKRGRNRVGSVRHLSVSLREDETRWLLEEVPQAYRTEITDILLAGLAEGFAAWTGERTLLLDLEAHGREALGEELDVSRTVGWFSSIYPVVLDLEGAEGPGAALKAVKEQLRSIPRRGAGYGVLRYLGTSEAVSSLRTRSRREVLFNYLGQLDRAMAVHGILRPGRESAGPMRHPGQERSHLLEINASITGGRLWLSWAYSINRHRQATIRSLAEGVVAALRRLIAHCLSPEAGGYTPSDFPLAGLGPVELDTVVERLGGRIEDLYPTSPMQQGLLFHSLDEVSSGTYVEQLSLRLSAGLEVGAFIAAWDRLVARQPVLRTGFVWDAVDRPLQGVAPRVEVEWYRRDWSALPAAERLDLLEAYLREDRRRGFDLSRPGLLRLALMELGEEGYQLVWSFHHILLDGWSLPVLLRELFGFYQEALGGESPDLGSVQAYRDYIEWLEGQELGSAEEFWRRQLAGFRAPTPLPSDGLGGSGSGGGHGSSTVAYPVATTEALRALARRAEVTFNTLLQAAWAVLLHRYSGEGEVVFGAVSSGRSVPVAGIESMVGLFINTLPVRVKVAGAGGLVPWLAEIQRQQAAVRHFEHSPLHQVQAWSEVPRGQPLFDSILAFENYPVDDSVREQAGEGLGLIDVDFREQTNYPLTLIAGPGLALSPKLMFDAGRFEATTIERMLRHLGVVLDAMAVHPEGRPGSLSLLSAAEVHQLCLEWNDTRTDELLADGCLDGRIAEAAAERPEAVAVSFEGEFSSYSELLRRTDGLASRLRLLGVGPDVPVGVYAERSLEMVGGLLAVLRAGGAYVPLSPGEPTERLARVLEDLADLTSRPVVLVAEGLTLPLPEDGSLLREPLRLPPAPASEPREVPAAGEGSALPDHLAYVIFTSGSTGKPKGVMNTHRAILNRLLWMQATYGLGPGDRVLQKTPFTFDVSVWEFFWPLLTGAQLVVARPDGHRDNTYLARLISERRISTLHFVPSMLNAFLETPDLASCDSLARVISSGEALSGSLAGRFAERMPAGRLNNLYGPTEAAVDVTSQPCEGLGERPAVPIGRPIGNLGIFLLDRYLRPVPLGVAGELCIGGVGLARGYVSSPRQTAERFVPDPVTGGEAERLYRTGDLARTLSDGRIDYLGRIDHQVKIRGFRIELGEVEAVLDGHPGVREVAVMARAVGGGAPRLVAFVVAAGEEAPTPEACRDYLAARLPDYMVPAFFIPMEALPLSPNGKLDRKALATVEVHRETGDGELALPRDATEARLAEIWCQVLHLDRVSVEANFFALGGDSILILQVVSRARRAGLSLTPRQMFDRPTIRELAEVVEGAEGVAEDQGWVVGPVELGPAQRWFFDFDLEHPEHFNLSLLLEVEEGAAEGGRLQGGLLRRAIARLLEHHDALRMRYRPPLEEGGEWTQESAPPGGPVPCHQVDLSALPPDQRGGVLERAAAAIEGSLDLGSGPLLRAVLFRWGSGGRGRLLLVVHHLVMDGVSWRLLLEDLEETYRQLAAGEPVRLPAKTASYQRWVRELRARARAGFREGELAYWEERLSRERVPLPVDRKRGRNRVSSVRHLSVSLSEEETRQLLEEVPRAYRTEITDVLLTGLVEGFAGWTGRRRLLLDMEGHGREALGEDLDVSRTLGWFTAIYPVLLELEGITGLGVTLKAVKEQLRSVPGRGAGYGALRYLGEPEVVASLRRHGRGEVLFNYLGQLDRALAQEGILRPSRESAGPLRHPAQERSHLLEINATITGGQLWMSWTYSASRHRQGTVRRLAEGVLAALRELIAHCLSPEAGGYTPSDFPLAGLQAEAPVERARNGSILDGGILDGLAERLGGRIEDLYPASPMQQGLLFHSLGKAGSGTYVEQLSLRLSAGLDPEAFRTAWERLVARQPILRTGFVWEGVERPLQAVVPEVALEWRREDWSSLAAGERRRRLGAFLDEDRRRGFDLSRPGLLRLAMMDLGAEGHQVVWSFHHILLDGWSLPLLLRELFAFYREALEGERAELGPVRPYRAYIAWLEAQELGAAEGFWRAYLAGFRASTPLPEERAVRGEEGGAEHGSLSVQLSVATTEALRALARRAEVTFNTVLQVAWAVLLHRYSGEGEVVFGAVSSGRSVPVPGIESMMGLFINTLPVRIDVAGGGELLPWLAEVQRQQAAVRQFEHSPLHQVQAWSEVPRGESLFDSIFAFENYPVDESVREQAGAGLGLLDVDFREQTHYPLTLLAGPDRALSPRLLFDTGRFEVATVKRMLRHLGAVLSAMAEHPERRPGSLPLLSPAEAHQLRLEWNDTRVAHSDERCVHQLVEEWTAAAPDRIAVACREERLSYGELDARARRLAAHLVRLGVGAEDRVVVAMERGPHSLVAMLAIFKVAAVYLPLVPTFPADRFRYILDDGLGDLARPVVLTTRELVPRFRNGELPTPEAGVVLAVDDLDDGPDGDSREELPAVSGRGPGLDHLAYLIYTSGSTGRPKGAMVAHRGMLNHLFAKVAYLGIEEADVVAQTASQSFDISMWQFLAALLVGGRVHIFDEETTRDPVLFRGLLDRARVTLVTTVPSFLEVLLDEVRSGDRSPTLEPTLESLRWMVSTGEALAPELARRWIASFPTIPLLNAYGPTECSDNVTHAVIGSRDAAGSRLPIGRPVFNLELHAVDPTGAPAPAGVVGELVIGGEGVGRGYLGRPRLTAERFIPDGLDAGWGGRLYRTGDLGRWDPRGSLECLGRIDHQVKIRGFRIELGEIEAALMAHPGVRKAVVQVRQERGRETWLIGFVVPRGPEPAWRDLQAFLLQSLPEYMVPAHFQFLPDLPLLPSGKVDRKTLSALPVDGEAEGDKRALHRAAAEAGQAAASGMGSLVARPSDPLVEAVLGLFAEVLGGEVRGTEDDFFRLGGHSLHAMRLQSRLRQALGVELPVAAIFEHPTAGDLAARVRRAARGGGAAGEAPLVPVDRDRPLPLSFSQQRLWFLDQLDPGSPVYNIAEAVVLEGELDVAAMAGALEAVVRRHESLRTTFAVHRGEPRQVIAPPGRTPLPVVDLSALGGKAGERVARELHHADELRPFDLARGPLLRISLLRLGEGRHMLLLVLHHIVSDGWSMEVLFGDVVRLYPALKAGEPSPLPPLPVQCADFAVWQRQRLRGEALDRLLAFWRGALAGAPPLLELPTDRPRPPVQTFRGGHVHFRLPPALHGGLREIGSRRRSSFFMLSLSAFATLLGRYSGQRDIVVGTPVANRDRVELEGLIGFFVNTLALRVDLGGEPTFSGLLDRVRASVLAARAHQDLPFERLVEELTDDRNLSYPPLVQVMLTVVEMPPTSPSLPGLDLRLVEKAAAERAKFDLGLTLVNTGSSLSGVWGFNRDLFDPTTFERATRHLEALLTAVVEHPDEPLRRLHTLRAVERHQVLVEWPRTDGPAAAPSSLADLAVTSGRLAPDAVAAVRGEEHLTYGCLLQRAGELAEHLRRLGVGPEMPVGVAVEGSAEALISLLGVLLAGGAYLPLDPTSPAERLSFLLADAGAPLVLASEAGIQAMGEGRSDGPEVIAVSAEGLAALAATELPADPEACGADPKGWGPNRVAYVIYTSGSTGRPNGVLVPHRGAVNLIRQAGGLYRVEAGDRVLGTASLGFDAAVLEIFLALAHGGTLVIADREDRVSPHRLARLVERHGVTVAVLTPAVLSVFPDTSLPRLRSVSVGGEACSADLAARWSQGRRLLNCYGPTESTIFATCAVVGAAAGGPPPIGRPVAGVEVFLLGPGFREVEIGLPGELVVGGVGLARGYLRRPGRTAEKFVPDPFADPDRLVGRDPGGRLYRSGDLARWRSDGRLDFLGRIDDQVKVHGFRIELGEVESAIVGRSGVREAVVVARGEGAHRRLVAYVVVEDPREFSSLKLATSLRESLPEYMVPGYWQVLPALPLTASGKVDRRALPEPQDERAEVSAEYAPPSNALERALAELWQEILQVDVVGIHDNFFELGGHSITGAVLINRLGEMLGEIVHVIVMFETPTVAGLAEYLATHYPEAVARLWGSEVLEDRPLPASESPPRVDHSGVAELRRLIAPLAPQPAPARKNPRAIFVLSPPRSGSTLLRVMLGGHPKLFAPPELELLSFNTLADRAAAFEGKNRYWLEGVIRALMQLRDWSAEQAEAWMAEAEAGGLASRELYRHLQEWIGGRILVDKTPAYALDLEVLRRAERDFDETLYVHLVRHPLGVVHSFVEARLDQVFFRHPHHFSRRELAELIWVVSQQNILAFLAEVPAERQVAVHYEALVGEPEGELRRLCAFLGLDYHPDMGRPYDDRRERMTDGIHPWSRMLGDVKFHRHSGVDASVAERWRERYSEEDLGVPTAEIAAALGYSVEVPDAAAWAPIAPVPRPAGADHPLSFAQERLWFMEQLAPGTAVYNIPLAVRLAGPLSPAALHRALSEVRRRHEALRTRFIAIDGEPRQEVVPAAEMPLPAVDLSGLDSGGGVELARRLARREGREPFDLASGRPLRCRLLRLACEEHAVLMTVHHIASDGWSMEVLARELGTLYRAFAEGEPSPLPEPAIDYVDFALWQRRQLSGPLLERQVAAWRRRLAGMPQALDLPLDHPRPATQSFAGSTLIRLLPGTLLEALETLSRRRGTTLFMTLLAAYDVLLARFSGQRDFAVGSPVAGRNHRQVEGMIGLFVNTVVLRSRLSPGEPFLDVLERVRETVVRAFQHQDLPFEKLIDALDVERDLSRSPLFQAEFLFQQPTAEGADWPGLRMEPLGGNGAAARVDLGLGVEPGPDCLLCELTLSSALFDDTTGERLLGHYAAVLEGLATAPETPWTALELLSPAERQALLVEWNDTAAPGSGIVSGPAHPALPAIVAARGSGREDAIAVCCGDEHLSVAALGTESWRLARRLRRLGVGPGHRVGIAVERGHRLPVVLLGVLEAGAAYVPLDPSYPRERLAFMAGDADLSLLITDGPTRGVVPLPPGVPELLAEEVGEEGAGGGAEPSAIPAAAAIPSSAPAYVIYTSGSTGRPKGVEVSHRGLVNFLTSMGEEPGVGADDVAVAVTPLSFDIAGLELYLPLLTGGRLVVARREEAENGELLARLLAEHRATALQATPTTWQLLLAAGWKGDRHFVALCGGEALPPSLAVAVRRRVARLWNLYGPTETTIWSAAAEIAPDGDVHIGRPIANTRIDLLDPAGEPVLPGAVGELWIGGDGLAAGYRQRPGLTAERFAPDPLSGAAGARRYRTGDLARHRRDGRLQCLGRIDHQIKVRGYRIELGEIETRLAEHPGVREAIVAALDDGGGGRVLVAFLIPRQEGDLPGEGRDELRSFLQQRLPDYMVPGRFHTLERFPLLPNGKVDRRALADLDTGPEELGRRDYVPPSDPLEEALVEVWEELLGVRPIGVRHDFFALGGHSLLAVRMGALVGKRLGRPLPVATIFEGATIEQLARRLRQSREESPSPLVPLRRGGQRRPFFCVHPVGGSALIYGLLAGHLDPEQPVYGLQAPGLHHGEDVAGASLEEMAATYVEAVRGVQPRGPYRLGGWSFGGAVAFEMARRLSAEGETIEVLALFDTQAPLGSGDVEWDDTAWMIGLAREEARQQGKPWSLPRTEIDGLPRPEQIERVLGELRRAEIVGSEIEAPDLERFLGGYKARMAALREYRPSPYPGPLLLLRAREADAAELAEFDDEARRRRDDPALGWEELALGGVEVEIVDGHHGTMVLEPHVRDLARHLARHLGSPRTLRPEPPSGPDAGDGEGGPEGEEGVVVGAGPPRWRRATGGE